MLLGADALTWYWAALIPLAAIGIGVYLAFRRRPSAYRAAQIVDRRLALADTLSTAVYFSGAAHAAGSPEVVRSQAERAEQAAGNVDLRQAIPYSMPRSLYVVAALALVASSLFALRYGFNKRLDLRAPLARIIHEQFTPRDRKEVAENMRRVPQPWENPDDSNDAAADQDQKGQGQKDSKSDDASQQGGDEQNGEKSGASKDDGNKQAGDSQSQDGDAQSQQSDDHDQQDSGQGNPNSQGQDKSNSDKQADGKQQSNSGGETGSLMSKLKDFAENLLSKVKPQPQNGQQQQSPNQNAKQSGGQQGGKQPQQQKDGQQSGSQQADSQDSQNGDSQKDGQDSQGKGSGQDKSQQATKQPGSGVGSEDGSKEIRQAEQLAAMGKISELIGKRSAAVTGEATVEVQNTSQQLHTAYVKSGAAHSQAGAEISRDEIPVALQPYVQQYFDQLRKQPAAAKKQ
jgi:hypothetical protein